MQTQGQVITPHIAASRKRLQSGVGFCESDREKNKSLGDNFVPPIRLVWIIDGRADDECGVGVGEYFNIRGTGRQPAHHWIIAGSDVQSHRKGAFAAWQ